MYPNSNFRSGKFNFNLLNFTGTTSDNQLHLRRLTTTVLCFCFLLGNLKTFSQCLRDLTDTRPVTVSALTSNTSFQASKAFDNVDNAYSGWSASHNAEPGNACWIRVYFSNGNELVRGYSISALDDNSGNNNKAPSDWKLQASNDGSTWTDLDSRTGEVFDTRGETHVYSFNNNTRYRYYRLRINQTFLPTSTQVAISEIQLFEEVCLAGTVFEDDGDRLSAYNPANDAPLAGVPVSIVTSPAGNIVASTATDASGAYRFNSADIPSQGSFSVIIDPPAGKFFVTHPANVWSTRAVFASIEDEPPTGAVFFDYHLNPATNRLSAVNRMKFAGGNIDFGLKTSLPPIVFTCGTGTPVNLITEAENGHFGRSSFEIEAAHPHQRGFSYDGNLYSSLPDACTDYNFSNTTTPTGSARGVLIREGVYTVTSFPGTLSDLSYGPYMSQMLNNVAGGWRKSYGTTTADVHDKFLAVNGATTGSLPFFKQTDLNLVGGDVYTLAFYGKHANSFAQGALADAQIVIEVMDNGNSVVTSGFLNLDRTTSFLDDRPESPWQLRIFTFTAPGGSGPFTVQLRASTTAAVGNDFYIDDIVLYPCSFTLLPLQVANFAAKAVNDDVNITWDLKTPSSGSIETEYSADGRTFFSLGAVELNKSQTNYTYRHQKPGAGIHYYRLKMIDPQGNISYSAIRIVDMMGDNSDRIFIYPNPVTDKLFVQSGEKVVSYEIIDASGRLVRKQNAGTNHLQVDGSLLNRGIYYIKLIKKDKTTIHKFVIRK